MNGVDLKIAVLHRNVSDDAYARHEMLTTYMAVFFLSLAITGALRPVLRRFKIVDVPNERSSHYSPTLRGAGLGPLLAFMSGFAISLFVFPGDMNLTILGVILGVAVSAGVLGFIEDVRGIAIRVRAGTQLFIGLVGSFAIVLFGSANWWLIPLFGLTIAAYINVANFMDGINGISAMHAIIVGSAYATVGLFLSLPWLTLAGIVLALSFAGFLPWNLLGGRVFLGDVGSYFLGASVAVIGIWAFVEGAPALAIVGPVVIYLADTGVTLVRRVFSREAWHQPHRTHAYQQLTDYRHSHFQSTLIVSVASMLTSIVGMLSFLVPGVSYLLVATLMLLGICGYFGYVWVAINFCEPTRQEAVELP